MAQTPEIWSEEALFRKAAVYVERAASADAESGLEALWSLAALELLARAALARVHPALLADPGEGSHLLFAFGYGEPRPPKSIPIASVFKRCQVVVASFTKEHTNDGIALMTLRNEELHSGGVVLEALPSTVWQPQFFSVCEVLLEHLDRNLGDFFPTDRASAAQKILDGLAENVESAVKQRIADFARTFKALEDVDRSERSTREPQGKRALGVREKFVTCPSCDSTAIVGGETAGASEPRVGDGEIEVEIRILPTQFRCLVCQLPLSGQAELFWAGLARIHRSVRGLGLSDLLNRA